MPNPDTLLNPRFAYREYLICRNSLTGVMWVEKDGALIGWARDARQARHIINCLLDPSPLTPHAHATLRSGPL